MTDRDRFFDLIAEGAFIGILAPQGAPHRTIAANPHLKQILGYPVTTPDAEVLLFAPERFADSEARTTLIERLQKDGRVANHLLHVRREDGSPAWIELTATAGGTSTFADATADKEAPPLQSGIATIFAIVRDVSDRKTLDDQSRDLHHQLLQSEKMAALGQTISGVAHELNNPLATILSWAERLAEQPADEKTRRGVGVILSESERAARIVRNLLTFARKRQTTRMMVELNDVMRETLALRAYEQRINNIDVVAHLADGIPEVFADAHQVKQVILNLLINAEQAMLSAAGRGTITVRTWHDQARGFAVFEVSDAGPGIAEAMLGKVFDPFYTTKEVGKGTGLGLSVAYGIVQEHGGRIWVTSEPGKGASFFVELPITGQPLDAGRPAGDIVSFDTFKGLRVLVVEDEAALGSAVAEALTEAGFVVERANDGEEGLTLAGHNRYDLIVCDLKMPKIDGMQFYRAMAAATPALARRVIFVTGAVAGTDAERFLAETGCRWLSKPFRLGDLLRAARDTLS